MLLESRKGSCADVYRSGTWQAHGTVPQESLAVRSAQHASPSFAGRLSYEYERGGERYLLSYERERCKHSIVLIATDIICIIVIGVKNSKMAYGFNLSVEILHPEQRRPWWWRKNTNSVSSVC